jgi:flavorubredoxin
MTKDEAVQSVGDQLLVAETAISVALKEYAKLMSNLMDASEVLKASPALGQVAIHRVSDAMTMISNARTATGEAHDELNKISRALNMKHVTSYVPLKPDVLDKSEPTKLSLVATTSAAS